MKNLLITTALIGFAGAAAADGHIGISFSGSADLGYNDTDLAPLLNNEDNVGFYSDLDITANFSAELDNGLTVAASLNLEDLASSDNGQSYELSLTNDTSGLYYGDTNFAAQNVWVSAGDMEADNFSEADGEEALRGEVTFGNVSAQMSYALADSAGVRNSAGGADDLEQLSLGVSADFGNVNVVAAYQEAFSVAAVGTAYNTANGDIVDADVFGLSVGTSFSGADVRLAYADNGTAGTDSLGLSVAYPLGPVTATAYYVAESAGGDNWGINLAYENGPISVTADYQDDQGTDDWGLEGSYDVGNGLVVFAGLDDSGDDTYIGAEYDLGSGASLLVSFADDSDNDEADTDDDIGAQGYQVGTTVELSFEF